jgi:hypothetical protein
MSPDDLNMNVIQTVVAQMAVQFDTWDVIRHPFFQSRYGDDGPQVNAAAGKFLRNHAPELGLRYEGQAGKDGSASWRRIGR